MTEQQYEALLPTLQAHMQPDRHGISTVWNAYCDTEDLSLIRRSVERPLFKEKLRLRCYHVPRENDEVFVELKRKLNGIGYKRRMTVTYAQAKRLLAGEAVNSEDRQVEREVLEFVRRYYPRPRVYILYRRYAMFSKDDPQLRITVDRELSFCTEENEQFKPIAGEENTVLLEIKTLNGVPPWLWKELSRLQIYQAPFSKVGTCFLRHLAQTL